VGPYQGASETKYLEEFDNKKFVLIQNELIKILSKTPNTYIEQSHLYEKLISSKSIKVLFNDSLNIELSVPSVTLTCMYPDYPLRIPLKYIFIMILRNLPIMSQNILIKKENNIFSGIFLYKKDGTDNLISLPVLEGVPKKDFIDLELPDKKTYTIVESEIIGSYVASDSHISSENSKSESFDKLQNTLNKKNNDNLMFPTETQVIQFIVDNDIKSFLFRKDYQGNTILHSLIIDCDSARIENLLKTNFYSFLERNNDGKTPLDLITDVNVSNVIHTILYQDLEYYSYKVNNLQMFIEKVDILFKYIVFTIVIVCIALVILVIYI
jgi:hypothetical protein